MTAVKYSSLGKHLWDVPIIELGDRFFIVSLLTA